MWQYFIFFFWVFVFFHSISIWYGFKSYYEWVNKSNRSRFSIRFVYFFVWQFMSSRRNNWNQNGYYFIRMEKRTWFVDAITIANGTPFPCIHASVEFHFYDSLYCCIRLAMCSFIHPFSYSYNLFNWHYWVVSVIHIIDSYCGCGAHCQNRTH